MKPIPPLRWRIATAVLALGLLAGASPAAAQTIAFDDVSSTTSWGFMPNSYQGLTWSNWGVSRQGSYPGTGIPGGNGTVSGNYAAFNLNGAPAAILKSAPFTLNSLYLTAAWNNALNVQVAGYNGGNLVHLQTVSVNTDGPTLFNLNWSGINQVRFTSFGGVNAGLGGSGTDFAMDNLTINQPVNTMPASTVPEPVSMALFLPGAAVLALFTRRRRPPTGSTS